MCLRREVYYQRRRNNQAVNEAIFSSAAKRGRGKSAESAGVGKIKVVVLTRRDLSGNSSFLSQSSFQFFVAEEGGPQGYGWESRSLRTAEMKMTGREAAIGGNRGGSNYGAFSGGGNRGGNFYGAFSGDGNRGGGNYGAFSGGGNRGGNFYVAFSGGGNRGGGNYGIFVETGSQKKS
jgi:hypothetical protein